MDEIPTFRVCFTHNGNIYGFDAPDVSEDIWECIEAYDDMHGTDLWDHLETDDILPIDGTDHREAAIVSWDDVVAWEGPSEVVCTKSIAANGSGLMISVTREARMMRLDRGDVVEVVLRKK